MTAKFRASKAYKIPQAIPPVVRYVLGFGLTGFGGYLFTTTTPPIYCLGLILVGVWACLPDLDEALVEILKAWKGDGKS